MKARRRRRAWQPDEVALLGTMPDPDLARLIDRPLRSVAAKRDHLGIVAHRWRQPPVGQARAALERSGLSLGEIAKIEGVAPTAVWSSIRNHRRRRRMAGRAPKFAPYRYGDAR